MIWRVKKRTRKKFGLLLKYTPKNRACGAKRTLKPWFSFQGICFFSRLRREGNIGNSGLLFADKFTFVFSPSGISVYFSRKFQFTFSTWEKSSSYVSLLVRREKFQFTFSTWGNSSLLFLWKFQFTFSTMRKFQFTFSTCENLSLRFQEITVYFFDMWKSQFTFSMWGNFSLLFLHIYDTFFIFRAPKSVFESVSNSYVMTQNPKKIRASRGISRDRLHARMSFNLPCPKLNSNISGVFNFKRFGRTGINLK